MYIDSHIPPGPSCNQEARDIFKLIQALDVGIANHESWTSSVNQTMVCDDVHANPSDLREDAHCRCKFGQWLYSDETKPINNIELFNTVEDNHRRMHGVARNILEKREHNEKITTDEYINFTASLSAFKLEVRNLQYALMSKVCVVDHLTGALNRYAMYAQLQKEKERLLRSGHPCTICMMDIDFFKRINDEYGHQTGDLVLSEVIEFCRKSLRVCDSIYRYGGEEFLLCLPDADREEIDTVIERLRETLSRHVIKAPNGDDISITASFGVACLDKSMSIEDTIQAADHALLCAKAQGRDRVCYWND